jgi:hypothetical protein
MTYLRCLVYLRCLATFTKRCLTTCVSVYLYDVCLPVWCLLSTTYTCIIPFFLYDLLNFRMSTNLYDVCFTLWCLFYYIMSAYLYNVYLAVWFLLPVMMSAQLYQVCLPVWCLSNCMTSAYLSGACTVYDVANFLTWCLPTYIIASSLNDVFLFWIYYSGLFRYRLNWYRISQSDIQH